MVGYGARYFCGFGPNTLVRIFLEILNVLPVLSGANKNNLIISPADGKVIEVSKVTPDED